MPRCSQKSCNQQTKALVKIVHARQELSTRPSSHTLSMLCPDLSDKCVEGDHVVQMKVQQLITRPEFRYQTRCCTTRWPRQSFLRVPQSHTRQPPQHLLNARALSCEMHCVEVSIRLSPNGQPETRNTVLRLSWRNMDVNA